jgi:hypothetical protein
VQNIAEDEDKHVVEDDDGDTEDRQDLLAEIGKDLSED